MFFSISAWLACAPSITRFSLPSSSVATSRRRSNSACRLVSWFLVCSADCNLECDSAAFCSACWLIWRFSSFAFSAASRRGVSCVCWLSSLSRSSLRPFRAVAASSCKLVSRSASLVIWAICRSRRWRASVMRIASRSHSPSSIRRF